MLNNYYFNCTKNEYRNPAWLCTQFDNTYFRFLLFSGPYDKQTSIDFS